MLPVDYLDALRRVYGDSGAPLALEAPLPPIEIDAALDAIGLPVPDWLKGLWNVADGGPSYTPVFTHPGFFTGMDFLSIADALALRNSMQAVAGNYADWVEPNARDGRVRAGWFLDGWLPFAAFGGSTMILFADCTPAESGEIGQVISFVHDPDQITLIAPDGETYLTASLEWFRDQAREFLPEEQ